MTETLSADIEKNNEFRIKWPRGELGSHLLTQEQFMLIEHIVESIGIHAKTNGKYDEQWR